MRKLLAIFLAVGLVFTLTAMSVSATGSLVTTGANTISQTQGSTTYADNHLFAPVYATSCWGPNTVTVAAGSSVTTLQNQQAVSNSGFLINIKGVKHH